MDTVYYLPEEDGRVRALLQPKDGIAPGGFISADRAAIPPLPEAKEGHRWCLYCTGSVFEWRAEEEPTIDDIPGSPEELSAAESRREAAVAAVKAQWPYPDEQA